MSLATQARAYVVVTYTAIDERTTRFFFLLYYKKLRVPGTKLDVPRVLMKQLLSIGNKTIVDGLAGVSWPGRMDLIQKPGGQLILLDGAHNPAGAEVLRTEVQKQFGNIKPTLVLVGGKTAYGGAAPARATK